MLREETIFLTGFPGFIAGRLVRELARGGARFLLLVQPAFAAPVPWAHLDIAATAWHEEPQRDAPAGATGAGVRTLIELVCDQDHC